MPQDSGMTLKNRAIVHATIIAAPGSTRNTDKQRDANMHQTRKSKHWCLGMRLHLGRGQSKQSSAQHRGNTGQRA